MQTEDFYNRYHQKNAAYSKIISRNNFTYFYVLEQLDYILSQLAEHRRCSGRPLRVLDVGCGVGALSLYLAKHGCSVVGIDISPDAIEIAESARQAAGIENCRFMVGELGSGTGSFDIVICSEIIEHVPDESAFLERVVSQLRVGGLLYLGTPSTETALYRLGLLKKFDAEVGHLRRYTEAQLREKIEAQGIVISQLRSVESPLRNLLFITRLGHLIRFIRGPLVPIFHWIDQLTGKVLGYSDIQVVGRKTGTTQ